MTQIILYIPLIVSVIGVLSNTYWMINESPIYYRSIKIWFVILILFIIFIFSF